MVAGVTPHAINSPASDSSWLGCPEGWSDVAIEVAFVNATRHFRGATAHPQPLGDPLQAHRRFPTGYQLQNGVQIGIRLKAGGCRVLEFWKAVRPKKDPSRERDGSGRIVEQKLYGAA